MMTIDRKAARQRLLSDLAAHDTAEIRAWLRDAACKDYAHLLDLPIDKLPTWALVWAVGRLRLDVSCAELDLEGADLQGADLRGAFLEEANLRGANLEEADLEEADLCEVNLEGANLRGVKLRGADLCEVNLEGALYNAETRWPEDFDPEAAGAVRTIVN